MARDLPGSGAMPGLSTHLVRPSAAQPSEPIELTIGLPDREVRSTELTPTSAPPASLWDRIVTALREPSPILGMPWWAVGAIGVTALVIALRSQREED